MPLAERSFEIGRLKHLYELCDRSKGQIVSLSGPTSSGKSELLHAFEDHVIASGGLLLAGVGSRAEQGIPFAVLGQLLENGQLPAEVRRLVGVLAAEASPTVQSWSERGPALWTNLMTELCTTLGSLLLPVCRERSVVISVDDLQHADGWSLEVLLFLMRRLRMSRAMIILSRRPARSLLTRSFRLNCFVNPTATGLPCVTSPPPAWQTSSAPSWIVSSLSNLHRPTTGLAAEILCFCEASSRTACRGCLTVP